MITLDYIIKEFGCTPEVAEQAMQGFNNYLAWESDNNIVVVSQEIELTSKEYGFGGCIDAVGYNSKSERLILDWKTGGMYVDSLLQVAAYKQLWDENCPDEPITGGCHICRFSKDHADFSHHFFNDLSDAWEQFKLFRQAFDLDKRLKKRI